MSINVKVRDERVCQECGAEVQWIANLNEGTDTGHGALDLFQCPKCKTIVAK